jgi:hypothetical protein
MRSVGMNLTQRFNAGNMELISHVASATLDSGLFFQSSLRDGTICLRSTPRRNAGLNSYRRYASNIKLNQTGIARLSSYGSSSDFQFAVRARLGR